MKRSLFSASPALAALLLIGCGDGSTSPTGAQSSAGAGGGAATSGVGVGGSGGVGGGTGGSGGTGGTSGSSSSGGPMCPVDMALADGFCVDRYEAPNLPGERPLVMESAVLAEQWCKEKGKRLCTEDEWDTACEGPNQSTYPYGDTHVDGQCNDDRTWKVVDEGALNTWPAAAAQNEVEKLWQGSLSGADPGCVSGYGVYDMTGNVEEWVVRTKPHVNSYPHVLKGCYWAGCFGGSKPTCQSTNPAHADGFMYYETGFRCCADLPGGG
jgi:formylglycine-generating enzyme required for sulfatase activity